MLERVYKKESDGRAYLLLKKTKEAFEEQMIQRNRPVGLLAMEKAETGDTYKYEITGRSSSWGMNLGQVMGILGIVMASGIILVGGIMFIWNKTRLKNGYVPKFEDEE